MDLFLDDNWTGKAIKNAMQRYHKMIQDRIKFYNRSGSETFN